MTRRKWLLAAAAGAVALVVGVGAALAQDAQQENGTSFLDRVAAKLGIDTPRLEQAIRDARNEEIDERVAAGDLTQEQAEALKERLEDLPADAFGGPFRHKPGFGFKFSFGPPGVGLCIGFDSESLSEFLGITPEQLHEELQAEDATLATVAEAHGKSREELRSFIEGEQKAKLDEAVEAGKITQERADELLADMRERIDELIDRAFALPPKPFFHDGPFRFREDAPDDGDTTPEQQGELPPAFRS